MSKDRILIRDSDNLHTEAKIWGFRKRSRLEERRGGGPGRDEFKWESSLKTIACFYT